MPETSTDTGQFEGASKIPTLVGIVGICLLFILVATIDITRGTISVSNVQSGSVIFIDNIRQLRNAPAGSVEFSLPPGDHTIMLALEGTWPWREDITVRANETVQVKPFLIAREPEPLSKVADNPGSSLVFNAPTPASSTPLYSDDQQVMVWAENEQLKARWLGNTDQAPRDFCSNNKSCDQPRTIYSTAPVHQVDFYPDRNDVIIFSDRRGVHAIELNPSGLQNFQPLYQRPSSVVLNSSNAPRFVVKNGSVFIQDRDQVLVSTLPSASDGNPSQLSI